MAYEEAIEILKAEYLGDSENMKMAKRVAVSALEKQIPKKPKAKKEEYEIVYGCPCCGRYFVSVIDGDLCGGQKYNYCFTCGQAIDWSDEE